MLKSIRKYAAAVLFAAFVFNPVYSQENGHDQELTPEELLELENQEEQKTAEKERICNLPIKDAKTGVERIQKVNVTDFLSDLTRKERAYNGIGMKGIEFQKINSSNEDAILAFVNKQISEIQSIFVIINALDAYFKNQVDTEFKVKVKGMQIELSALRNSIINANKKRGEYASFKEEHAQMQKLGLSENA